MASLTINTYTFTITKDTASKYTLVAPASIVGTTSPTYTLYSVSSSGVLTEGAETSLLAGSQSDEFSLSEGLYLLLFEGFHASNKYWIVLGSYQELLNCLLGITKNLITNNLCDNCYKNYKQDGLIVMSALNYFTKLEYYWINAVSVTTIATSLSAIPAYAQDIVLANKLFTNLQYYCDNCLSSNCNDC